VFLWGIGSQKARTEEKFVCKKVSQPRRGVKEKIAKNIVFLWAITPQTAKPTFAPQPNISK
jgi:hypothetical protein